MLGSLPALPLGAYAVNADLPFSFYSLAMCVLLVASDRAAAQERKHLLTPPGSPWDSRPGNSRADLPKGGALDGQPGATVGDRRLCARRPPPRRNPLDRHVHQLGRE